MQMGQTILHFRCCCDKIFIYMLLEFSTGRENLNEVKILFLHTIQSSNHHVSEFSSVLHVAVYSNANQSSGEN